MPRVICDLPNASDEINGIKFHPLDDGGRISDEIDSETAALFASIPGYVLDDGSSAPVEPVKPAAPKTRQAKAVAAKPVKAAVADEAPAVPSEPAEPTGGASEAPEEVF